MEFVNNVTISGIFKVTNVISRFINGAFTQSLEAIRDIGTNYEIARPTLLKFTNEETLEANRATSEATSKQVGGDRGGSVKPPKKKTTYNDEHNWADFDSESQSGLGGSYVGNELDTFN